MVAHPHTASETLESAFSRFRKGIVGIDASFDGPYGRRQVTYIDWTASGRLYRPIEEKLLNEMGPLVGNTHSESNITGGVMTEAYHRAHDIIKRHVNAAKTDALLFVGFGMTSAVCKLQRMLGLRIPEQVQDKLVIAPDKRPVVFVTHMEHHSNQTSWEETIADVVVLPAKEDGLVEPSELEQKLQEFRDRPMKIGAFTACSNVTGIFTPYHSLARIMHKHGGLCFVDLAACAPYADIDMHPADPLGKLDAITFSPHKFLGGPGSSGVLIFDSSLYNLRTPDQPGGGTVLWTNPWGGHRFYDDIELREDGGTPGFLQAIKAALAVQLKEEMGTGNIHDREAYLVAKLFAGLKSIPGLHILADGVTDRLPIISFYIDDIHYNLIVRLLNDRYGIQVRGGCSCAGTYGHYLLHVDQSTSKEITEHIDHGDLSMKPGWVRASLHPTTLDSEAEAFISALREIREHAKEWEREYTYSPTTNEYVHTNDQHTTRKLVDAWFGE